MRWTHELQAPFSFGTGVQSAQFVQDALTVGNGKTGVVFVDVYAISGTGVLEIQTCSDVKTTVSGLSSWIGVGSATVGAIGTYRFAISELGDAIRWALTTAPTSITFGVRVYLSDKT